jgi:hypothetical protein
LPTEALNETIRPRHQVRHAHPNGLLLNLAGDQPHSSKPHVVELSDFSRSPTLNLDRLHGIFINHDAGMLKTLHNIRSIRIFEEFLEFSVSQLVLNPFLFLKKHRQLTCSLILISFIQSFLVLNYDPVKSIVDVTGSFPF